jgi:hypothetical protein
MRLDPGLNTEGRKYGQTEKKEEDGNEAMQISDKHHPAADFTPKRCILRYICIRIVRIELCSYFTWCFCSDISVTRIRFLDQTTE